MKKRGRARGQKQAAAIRENRRYWLYEAPHYLRAAFRTALTRVRAFSPRRWQEGGA